MKEKYSELAYRFREKANENMFLLTKYSNANGRDLWGCICSAMDWIDVGIQYIENFQPPARGGLQNCMKIYSLITAIDITYEAIISLFWVLQKNGENDKRGHTPFYQTKGCFSSVTNDSITDGKFFKEIRSCCGAHPTDLNTLISDDESEKKQRRYASWIVSECEESFHINLYPENATGKTIIVRIFYTELIEYFEQRFNYLNTLIQKIDELYNEFRREKANDIIQKSDNPIEQLKILKEANAQRLNKGHYNDIIDRLISFFNTEFSNKGNSDIIEKYKNELLLGMETLYYNIQYLDYQDMTLDNLLDPPQIDVEWFGYEFAALFSQIFVGIYKPYNLRVLTEPLKDIICFDSAYTDEEFYWLIVIALNIIDENNNK